MPALYDGMQTCLAYKGHKTWRSVVARVECSVRIMAERWGESIGHDSAISPIVSECMKLGLSSDDAEPCSTLIIIVQELLFGRSCLDLQDSLDFCSGTIIGFFVRNRTWSSPLQLMRRLLFPTDVTERAFADVAIFSILTISFTIIAQLVANFPPAQLGRPSLIVSSEAIMSADMSATGYQRLDTVDHMNAAPPRFALH